MRAACRCTPTRTRPAAVGGNGKAGRGALRGPARPAPPQRCTPPEMLPRRMARHVRGGVSGRPETFHAIPRQPGRGAPEADGMMASPRRRAPPHGMPRPRPTAAKAGMHAAAEPALSIRLPCRDGIPARLPPIETAGGLTLPPAPSGAIRTGNPCPRRSCHRPCVRAWCGGHAGPGVTLGQTCIAAGLDPAEGSVGWALTTPGVAEKLFTPARDGRSLRDARRRGPRLSPTRLTDGRGKSGRPRPCRAADRDSERPEDAGHRRQTPHPGPPAVPADPAVHRTICRAAPAPRE